jgi:hypothetical protein
LRMLPRKRLRCRQVSSSRWIEFPL